MMSLADLTVLDALDRTRNVTAAARKVGLSQPAVSRTWARLRAAFADPLFVRTAGGLVPTARAVAVLPEVREVLQRSEALLRPPTFAPARLHQEFVLATTDFVEITLVPALARRLEAEAPGVRVVSRPMLDLAPVELRDGRLDLLVGPAGGLPPDLTAQRLFDEHFRCAARADHPRIGKNLSLAAFVRERHVLIAPRGEPGSVVDAALARQRLTRQIAVRTQSFLSAPILVAESDLIVTAPSRILALLAPRFGLRVFAPPLPLPSFRLMAAWHPSRTADPAHRWFRELVAAVAASTRDR